MYFFKPFILMLALFLLPFFRASIIHELGLMHARNAAAVILFCERGIVSCHPPRFGKIAKQKSRNFST